MNFLGSALTTIKPRKDDTLIDRLNYYYTSMIIIGLSVTLTVNFEIFFGAKIKKNIFL
uniref:Uncharacterized protein n=1 Tax=Meloidogyne incognita TaxID=6306 RepID=A0A914MTQ9_MELIC